MNPAWRWMLFQTVKRSIQRLVHRKCGLLVCAALYSYHPIHSQSVQAWISHTHTHAALPPVSLKEIQAVLRHAGPIKAAPKKNKLMSRSASEESLQGISESTICSLLRKTLYRTYSHKIILPWASSLWSLVPSHPSLQYSPLWGPFHTFENPTGHYE